MTDRFTEHQRKAGRARTEKKRAAILKNLEKAWSLKRQYPSQKPQAVYQRARRARLKKEIK